MALIDFRDSLVEREPRRPPPAPVPPTPTPTPSPTPTPTPTPNPTPAPPTPAPTPAPPAAQTYRSALEGFDSAKFDDPTHQTVKYQFARIAAKYPATQAGFAQLVADPEFQKLGLQSVGNGNVRMPDGSVVDVVRGYGAGGQGWQWGPVTGPGGATLPGATTTNTTGGYGTSAFPTGPPTVYGTTPNNGGYYYNPTTGQYYPTGGASGYVPGMGTNPPGYPSQWQIPGQSVTNTSEFSDPTTAAFEKLLNQRIAELSQPLEDKSRTQYASLMQQNVEDLSQSTPSLENLISQLEAQARSYQNPTDYTTAAKGRIEQLQQEPYTGAEWELYRTAALDPIEQDRKAAQDRIKAQIAQRGLNPADGPALQLMLEADRGFDQSRAAAQNSLGQSRVALRDARSQQAVDLQEALTGLTDSRGDRSAQLYGTLADIPQARAQQQLSAAEALAQLSEQVRAEEQSRRSEGLALSGQVYELPQRSLQMALATLGQGEAPSSIMNSLMGLAGLANQKQAMANQNQQGLWSGLGGLLAYLSQGTGGGGSTPTLPGVNVGIPQIPR